jgi:hypothetical protein
MRNFDGVELLTIVGFSVVATLYLSGLILGRPAASRGVDEDVLATVTKRYGPDKFSQGPEEWLIRDFFKDKRNGVFLDVGAFDARNLSNTCALERDFGWSGIAIDAIAEFAPGYREFRPQSRFVVAFVGDRDVGEETCI